MVEIATANGYELVKLPYRGNSVRCFNNLFICKSVLKGGEKMNYEKPEILAQSIVRMAECRPNSKPSGRPCNPPGPGGR